MNFEELGSQSFSTLFVEEFGHGDGKCNSTINPSHSLKKSYSRRSLMKKASSIRNVMLGKSSSEHTALLTDSSDDMDDIAEIHEELHEASEKDAFLSNDLNDLFKGQFDDPTSPESSSTPSNTEQATDDVKREPKSPGVAARRRKMGRSSLNRGPSSHSPMRSPSARRLVVDPLSLSDHNSARRSPASRGQQGQRRRSRPGRRRSAGAEDNPSTPKKHTLRNLEMALSPGIQKMPCPQLDDEPQDEKPRLQPSKSSSAADKDKSKAANVSVRRTRSSGGGRRGGRKASYMTGDRVSANDVDQSSRPLAVSDGQGRGRARTSNNDPQEHVDKRVEWRSKSKSRRNLMEGGCEEKKHLRTPPRRPRPSLVRAESLNGKRLSQLNF